MIDFKLLKNYVKICRREGTTYILYIDHPQIEAEIVITIYKAGRLARWTVLPELEELCEKTSRF